MNLNTFTKETITIVFYALYIAIAYLLYTIFPGNETVPNMGIVSMFLLIPISLSYAFIQAYKHFNSDKSYLKCLLIHAVAWFSIITFLTSSVK